MVNHLHASFAQRGQRPFDTVRALFPEGQPLYPGAGFLAKTHVQLAVRRPEQIRGVFRVPALELAELGLPELYADY